MFGENKLSRFRFQQRVQRRADRRCVPRALRAQHDALEGVGLLFQHVQNRLQTRSRGLRHRVAVRARRQTGERDRLDALLDAQHQRFAVATRQLAFLELRRMNARIGHAARHELVKIKNTWERLRG